MLWPRLQIVTRSGRHGRTRSRLAAAGIRAASVRSRLALSARSHESGVESICANDFLPDGKNRAIFFAIGNIIPLKVSIELALQTVKCVASFGLFKQILTRLVKIMIDPKQIIDRHPIRRRLATRTLGPAPFGVNRAPTPKREMVGIWHVTDKPRVHDRLSRIHDPERCAPDIRLHHWHVRSRHMPRRPEPNGVDIERGHIGVAAQDRANVDLRGRKEKLVDVDESDPLGLTPARAQAVQIRCALPWHDWPVDKRDKAIRNPWLKDRQEVVCAVVVVQIKMAGADAAVEREPLGEVFRFVLENRGDGKLMGRWMANAPPFPGGCGHGKWQTNTSLRASHECELTESPDNRVSHQPLLSLAAL